MQYMLLFTETAAELEKRNDPAEAPAYWGAWSSYAGTLANSGIMVCGAGLQPPSTATTLRIRDGKHHVQDGPYAETKEILGGFFVIEVADLDEALAWAARSPSASCGAVEIRPTLPPPPRD
jgi:hypothetical protein